eukprot:Gb_27926 [translate_table: standard]
MTLANSKSVKKTFETLQLHHVQVFRYVNFHVFARMHNYVEHKRNDVSVSAIAFVGKEVWRDKTKVEQLGDGFVNKLCNEGRLKDALNIVDLMNQQGIRGKYTTYSHLIRECANVKALEEGKRIHEHLIRAGFQPDIVLSNHIINMYGKCGSLLYARQVFDKMPERNLVSWTAIIAGYAQHGCGVEALRLFCQMHFLCLRADQFTFASVLRACASLADLERGRQVHCHVMKTGFELDEFVQNALVVMYAECRSIVDARKVFDEMSDRDVVSWSTMIAGYTQNSFFGEALQFFGEIQRAGIKPNQFTFGSIFKACASLSALEQGKQVHTQIIKTGFQSNVFVDCALCDMYAKCGSLESARKMFDQMPGRDVVSWNAMIAGYAQNGDVKEALKIFSKMRCVGMRPDTITLLCVLSACASADALEWGKQIHAIITETGFEVDVSVVNALVAMYAKCGNLTNAFEVFDRMSNREVVSWNVMIAAYVQHGLDKEAFHLLEQMKWAGMKPNQFTFGSVLSLCASLATLGQGNHIHVQIIKTGFMIDVFVGNALVDMYAKCGSIEDAREVFEKMLNRDVISWSAMIVGYAQHGHGKEALQLFKQMQKAGVKPNHITFVGVLFACSHVGLVDEGRYYFDSMRLDHGLIPTMEHCACMVDILGRAGHLVEAEAFVKKMLIEPDAIVWRALLSACRIHGNMELGKRAADCILKLEAEDASTYVLLSNIYAAANCWDDVAKVRKLMKDRGVRKEPGQSWIKVKNHVHTFVVEDRSHHQMEEIYAKLEELDG